ncbi:hypothetical protein [uncultured Bifidobacterium sp.]|uniref:hypothetical protein n=1 Tax=uncultured Bifidobacterium sp. TaxID=165187 RepID=UPI00258D9143|nr:hypothetical protein [uncultured Bifidobacterium sp.]
MKHTLHSTITPASLKAGRKSPTGWYITQDRQTLINIDKDGWITCYNTAGDSWPIYLADGYQGTLWTEVLNRTIGNQPAYRLTDITVNEQTLYEATCDED